MGRRGDAPMEELRLEDLVEVEDFRRPSQITVETDEEQEEELEEIREALRQLDQQKTALEEKLTEALKFLASTPVGLRGRLVDDEGYPRADCDLHAVRTARNTADSTRNDLRRLNERIFALLNALHGRTQEEAELQMAQDAAARRERQARAEKQAQRVAEVQRVSRLRPCFKVVSVHPGSPAEEAGLTVGMQILQYGGVAEEEIKKEGPQAIAKETAACESVPITVWVRVPGQEDSEPSELLLVPQRWRGPGLLGCTLDSLQHG